MGAQESRRLVHFRKAARMKTSRGKIDLRPARSFRRSRRVGSTGVALLLLLLALMLPGFAIYRLSLEPRWLGALAAYTFVINAITFWIYAIDKRRAEAGEWRISEAQLHLFELLGGWPGAWLAQRHLRHKCSKASYQFVFGLVVLSYQFAAIDSFQNWKLSRAGMDWIQHTSQHSR